MKVEEENECSYDYVEVYDGSSDSAARFGRFCGKDVSLLTIKFSYTVSLSWTSLK